MKKGRHRRFEEARALKRSHEVDLDGLLEDISESNQEGEHKPEHDAWADLAEEWENNNGAGAQDDSDDDSGDEAESGADDDATGDDEGDVTESEVAS